MPYTIHATLSLVVQETPGVPSPMLLPWQKALTDAGTTARIGGGLIPAATADVPITFPNLTTLSTLWFFPEADMEITLGDGTHVTAVPVQAGGCFGFIHGSLPATDALLVTNVGAEPAGYSVVWGGT